MANKVNEEENTLGQNAQKEENAPRIKPIIEAADSLSLGISVVVAVVMGVGIGYLLRSLTGIGWTFWIGIFIGIAAAILNVFKVYEKQRKSYEELAKEPRYAIKKQLEKDSWDDADDMDYGEKNY
ncbi:MAG: arginine biosynthesis protein ArgJ [Helicobacteraceae bacterium CG2_30_36_10]|nr:MAG: arginine biosynthesis protein ArgJ [Helicobacteraceae bacterium CG2_30_36_10]